MKLPCEIVQDLLPLYEEDLCSPVSRAAVEEHLQECEKCRGLIEDIQKLKEPEMPVEASAEEQAVTRSFRKIHRKWRGNAFGGSGIAYDREPDQAAGNMLYQSG